jgi:predicted DNA binding CopG/RHH family protein
VLTRAAAAADFISRIMSQGGSKLTCKDHFATLILLLQCSYNVAFCQEENLFLTCSYTRATLWHMAKSKKKTTAKSVKDEMIRFRASTEEKRALEETAQREGLPLSSWIRRVLLREAGLLPEAK